MASEFQAYLGDQPYGVGVHFDSATRILTLSVNIEKTPDPMWGVKIGEIVHNVRSALDHLVWELVTHATGRAPALPSTSQFPIFSTPEGFRARGVPQHLKGMSDDAIQIIEAEQPFATGEADKSPLWHLRELSNVDKHRTLHITGTMVREYRFTLPALLEPLTYEVLESALVGPIQQDAVLWRARFSGILLWPWAERNISGALETNIAFDRETPVVGGWIVLATLDDIVKRAEHVIRTIARDELGLTL